MIHHNSPSPCNHLSFISLYIFLCSCLRDLQNGYLSSHRTMGRRSCPAGRRRQLKRLIKTLLYEYREFDSSVFGTAAPTEPTRKSAQISSGPTTGPLEPRSSFSRPIASIPIAQVPRMPIPSTASARISTRPRPGGSRRSTV